MSSERPKFNYIHQADDDADKKPLKVAASESEWTAERLKLLQMEKELIRMKDAVTAARRQLPWLEVAKAADYKFFDHTDAERKKPLSLKDLFFLDAAKPLVIQHMMWFGEGGGCGVCSTWVDSIGAVAAQLSDRLQYVVVAHATDVAALHKFVVRKGWDKNNFFKVVADVDGVFGNDFQVSRPENVPSDKFVYNFQVGGSGPFAEINELPGISVFATHKDAPSDKVFRTTSVYQRGLEGVMDFYAVLDQTPRGRQGIFPRHREEIAQPGSAQPAQQ